MANVGGITLAVLIRVLDEKINSLDKKIREADPEDESLADWEEMLLVYSKAEMELKAAYEQERVGTNLRPYEDLIR